MLEVRGPMNVLDFNAARRARGLPALAGPGRLDRATADDLRRWRCFEVRIKQSDAANAAGVSCHDWAAAECGRAVHADVLARVVCYWQVARNNGNQAGPVGF